MFSFKCRTFLQPVPGSTWDLHGDLAISLCMRPFTKHQVWDINRSPPVFTLIPPSPNTHTPLWPYDSLLSNFVLNLRCCRIRVCLHPWGQKRRGHIFSHSTETLQWVAPHLCWSADNWRGPPEQEQKNPVRPPNDQVVLHVTLLLFGDINIACKRQMKQPP